MFFLSPFIPMISNIFLLVSVVFLLSLGFFSPSLFLSISIFLLRTLSSQVSLLTKLFVFLPHPISLRFPCSCTCFLFSISQFPLCIFCSAYFDGLAFLCLLYHFVYLVAHFDLVHTYYAPNHSWLCVVVVAVAHIVPSSFVGLFGCFSHFPGIIGILVYVLFFWCRLFCVWMKTWKRVVYNFWRRYSCHFGSLSLDCGLDLLWM